MACQWVWDFGIGLPESVYAATDWDTTGTVVTNSTTILHSPSGSNTPGDVNTCGISGSGAAVVTPAIAELDSAEKGWFCGRCTINSATISAQNLMGIRDGATLRIVVRATSSGTSTTLYIVANAVTIGTTGSAIANGDAHYYALKFDCTTNPIQAGLWIDGVNAIAYGNGGAGPQTCDRLLFGGAGGAAYWNTLSYWDDPSGDEANAIKADTWSYFLAADGVSDDTEWSIFGGSASKEAAMADKSTATGVETTTDPSDLVVEAQDRADVLASWNPTDVYLVQATACVSADVLTDADITLQDSSANTLATTNKTLTATPTFMWAGHHQDNGGNDLVAADIDDVRVFFECAS